MGGSHPRPSSLPRPLTSFIGRDRDLNTLAALLLRDDVRLVTVVGPGGVGKTRVAIHTATPLRDRFPGGTWFVGLAPIRDPVLVAPTIAQTLGVREQQDQDILATLIAALQGQQTLLILDNFEQVLEAGLMVAALLSSCSDLTILATSRAMLRLSGEHAFSLLPMPQPDAVRLFEARATAAMSEFALTDENSDVIATICQQLDGLPLAIELAAARVAALSPASLLAQLEARLSFLTGGPRDQPARLRSMRDAIAWSYDLLSAEDQTVFRRLAVFVGGWTLNAAEAVVDEGGIVDRLCSLIDKNMIRRDHDSSGQSRFSFLATVREFASEQLEAHGETATVKQRHAEYFLQRAAICSMVYFLPDGLELVNRLNPEDANLRAALTWFAESGDAENLLKLSFSLCFYWTRLGGRHREAREWLDLAVTMGRAARAPSIAKGLVTLGLMIHLAGDEPSAMALVTEVLEYENDPETLYRGLTFAGLVTLRLNELATAADFQQRALTMLAGVPDAPWQPFAISTVLGHLGNIAVAQGEIDTAERYFNQAIDRQRERGFEPGTSHLTASHPIAGLGDVARARCDHAAALDAYQTAVRLAQGFHDYRAVAYALGGVAGTLAARGRWRDAARIFGATEAMHHSAGIHFDLETMDRQRALGLPEPWQRAADSFGAGQPLRDALKKRGFPVLPRIPDPHTADRLWNEGRSLSVDQAVAEATAHRWDASPNPTGLTPREKDILRLLAQGMTDQEMADTLFVSRRTAATHVRNIFEKLNVTSRAAAAAQAVRLGLA
jgi:predicted ATPase/DNA-binding CsgD family transcriptional regulator